MCRLSLYPQQALSQSRSNGRLRAGYRSFWEQATCMGSATLVSLQASQPVHYTSWLSTRRLYLLHHQTICKSWYLQVSACIHHRELVTFSRPDVKLCRAERPLHIPECYAASILSPIFPSCNPSAVSKAFEYPRRSDH